MRIWCQEMDSCNSSRPTHRSVSVVLAHFSPIRIHRFQQIFHSRAVLFYLPSQRTHRKRRVPAVLHQISTRTASSVDHKPQTTDQISIAVAVFPLDKRMQRCSKSSRYRSVLHEMVNCAARASATTQPSTLTY